MGWEEKGGAWGGGESFSFQNFKKQEGAAEISDLGTEVL